MFLELAWSASSFGNCGGDINCKVDAGTPSISQINSGASQLESHFSPSDSRKLRVSMRSTYRMPCSSSTSSLHARCPRHQMMHSVVHCGAAADRVH